MNQSGPVYCWLIFHSYSRCSGFVWSKRFCDWVWSKCCIWKSIELKCWNSFPWFFFVNRFSNWKCVQWIFVRTIAIMSKSVAITLIVFAISVIGLSRDVGCTLFEAARNGDCRNLQRDFSLFSLLVLSLSIFLSLFLLSHSFSLRFFSLVFFSLVFSLLFFFICFA